ncbi:MAG: class I SAM-dependent methyltransferase [Roseibium sp.]|nr:class I SAM-dependent methyltransferase [Roseibium sp.]
MSDPALIAVSETIRKVLTHIHDALGVEFSFELADGTLVPPEETRDGLRLFISDTALPKLLRSPSLKTIIELYAAGEIDPRGGTIFDFASKRPSVKAKTLFRQLDKRLLLGSAWSLYFAPRESGSGSDAQSAADTGGGTGSAKTDIAFHYNVSNAFYRLFLDPEMLYTCAYFQDWDNDLATAQQDKLEMICRKLQLKPGDRLLDIGCGWGGLICYAAEHHGVDAVGVTLSEEQAKLARERVRDRGLEARVSVELKDYREYKGQFDKISSIGMFEHVGIDNHDDYYRHVNRLLKPRGLYLHHAITRRGKKDLSKFRRKKPEYQTLVRYIFPGGEVDHIGWTLTNLESHGFEVHDVEAWREHYARTTRLWAENLMEAREEAVSEVGEEKYRLWLAYLCGVSLGFERGSIGIFQTVATKRTRGLSGMPPTREDLYRS